MTPELKPDPLAIRVHLERLFRRARLEYPQGRCEIAWADTKGAVNSAETFAITPDGLDAAAAAAARYNAAGRNTYVGINPRKPGSPPFGRASAGDVEIAFNVFIDGDSLETAQRLRNAPIPYTWAVTTGRIPNPRPQAYWELEEPVRNLPLWSQQQLALAEFFGADHVIDPPRIMRLAGTVNYPSPKKAARGYVTEPVTIRTLYDGEERDPVALEALAQAYPPAAPNGHAYSNGHANGHAAGFDAETGEVFEEAASKPNFDTDRLTIRSLLEAISADRQWHNNTLRLIAHMVNRGDPDALILALAPAITVAGYTISQTHAEISQMLRSARAKWDIPNQDEDFSVADKINEPLILLPIGILNPKARAPRDWLVPNRMMRRHITMTTAAPGVGKSTLAIEEAISLASGNDFLGLGIKAQHRVAVVNNEETRDELERRIEATCAYFEIASEVIAENLFVYSGVDAEKLILARTDKNGNVLPTIRAGQLQQLTGDLKLDLVILDPFVQLHYAEESSNEQISRVMVQLRGIGSTAHPAAIHVVHHNRKPVAGNSHQAGDISSARGASSMGGEAHFFFTLTDMGEQDGEKLNIPENDRVNFLRLDDAKRKMSPAMGAQWFERHGVWMPYGLIGEEVGVLIPRSMSDIEVETSVSTATLILQAIEQAWQDKTPYNASPQSKERYVIYMMMREFQMTRQAAKHLIEDWQRNGMIVSEIINLHDKAKGLRVLKWPG